MCIFRAPENSNLGISHLQDASSYSMGKTRHGKRLIQAFLHHNCSRQHYSLAMLVMPTHCIHMHACMVPIYSLAPKKVRTHWSYYLNFIHTINSLPEVRLRRLMTWALTLGKAELLVHKDA